MKDIKNRVSLSTLLTKEGISMNKIERMTEPLTGQLIGEITHKDLMRLVYCLNSALLQARVQIDTLIAEKNRGDNTPELADK